MTKSKTYKSCFQNINLDLSKFVDFQIKDLKIEAAKRGIIFPSIIDNPKNVQLSGPNFAISPILTKYDI